MIPALMERDRIVGMRVFNEPRGVLGLLKAYAWLQASRSLGPHETDPELIADVNDGFHGLGRVSNTDRIDRLRDRLTTLLQDDTIATVDHVDGREATRRVSSLDTDIASLEEFDALISDPAVRRAVRGYFGTDATPAFINVLQYNHVPAIEETDRDVRTRDWHIDPYTPAVRDGRRGR